MGRSSHAPRSRTPILREVSDVRLAELLAALSLAGDLGHGRTLEYSLRTAYLSCRLAVAAGLDAAERRDALYVGLLQAIGWVANPYETAPEGPAAETAFKSETPRPNSLTPPDHLKGVAP